MSLVKHAVAVFLLAAAACADKTPARIEVSSPSITLFDRASVPVGARLVNGKGEQLAAPALSYSATPVSRLAVGADGSVSCRESGDGTIVVAGGGQSSSITVSCRIVATIRAPVSTRLILGRAPEPASFEALDDQGRRIDSARITYASSAPLIAKYANGALVPVGLGHASVTATAGGVNATVEVSVVEMIKSQPLAIADGASITWTLQQGSYELDLQVKATGSMRIQDGVTVSWVGAECPDAAEKTEHHIKCTVAQTASLTIRNPTALGLGPTLNGFINLYRTER